MLDRFTDVSKFEKPNNTVYYRLFKLYYIVVSINKIKMCVTKFKLKCLCRI